MKECTTKSRLYKVISAPHTNYNFFFPPHPGTEEIMEECTADILKAEKLDKMARKKAWKQRQKASAAKAWEPSKRNIADHLKFVLTACMDEYEATVASIKKYVANHYASEFDLANKINKFKNVRYWERRQKQSDRYAKRK